jgi:hypothetical protein
MFLLKYSLVPRTSISNKNNSVITKYNNPMHFTKRMYVTYLKSYTINKGLNSAKIDGIH